VSVGLLLGGTTNVDKEQWLISGNEIISISTENILTFKAGNEAKGNAQQKKRANLKVLNHGKGIKTKYRNNTYAKLHNSKLTNKVTSLSNQKQSSYSFLRSYHREKSFLTSLRTVVLLH
jgi:hypothetical protein